MVHKEQLYSTKNYTLSLKEVIELSHYMEKHPTSIDKSIKFIDISNKNVLNVRPIQK